MNKDKSIKDLKQYNDKIKMQLEYAKIRIYTLDKEIERLHSIIKEVRDLLQKANIYRNYDEDDTWYTDLNIDEALEILDKVEEKK